MNSAMPTKPIRLIVGLGNPGPDYAQTRHNAGAWFVEAVSRHLNAGLMAEKGFQGDVARARLAGGDLWLLVPTTFMNRSGQSVGALAKFYKIAPEEILVAHDELDIPPGTVKLKQGGGSAGHNGLKDITAHLGSPAFWRLRLGIGHPRTLQLQQAVADFVLHRPRSEEQKGIDACIDRSLNVLPALLKGDFPTATRDLHAPDKTGKP